METEEEEPKSLDVPMGTNTRGQTHYGLRSLGPILEEVVVVKKPYSLVKVTNVFLGLRAPKAEVRETHKFLAQDKSFDRLLIMSFHNYVHNSNHGDDYIEDPGRVTLISKLDISKNKTGFINGSCKRSNIYEVLGRQMDKVNAFVFEELFLGQTFQKGQNMFGKNLKKLMISFILSMEVLPDVRTAYATISCEESHRVASGSIVGSSQRNQDSAFVSNVTNRNNFQINNQNANRENQQMTYTDKELDNVLDISHLKINVGHPNGTETFISKIGNLKLSNCLVLYDVLVIPEYCVTLISVPRLAKEN
ncbi:hypothetical protein Tco_0890603 [Tanacetum coccineum]|uniref:Uncharacterized protein n=1 Tax=Tanacetum coccineum TaxID=301880 RepID=A0ABQ5C0X4_9ASTR